jgi:uncharacterized protein YbcI
MNNQITKGQMEDTITKAAIKFYVENLGTGPEQTRVYIIEDMIIIRFKGKLLPIEEKIIEHKESVGIYLVKQGRKAWLEMFLDSFRIILKQIIGHEIVSAHGDISTKTGERVEIFVIDCDYEALLK